MTAQLSEIFTRHANELRTFLRGRRGASDADDLVQEGFVRLIQAASVESPTNARAWLYRTCSNLAADAFDHQRVRRRVLVEGAEFDALPDECADPVRQLGAREELQQVWRALMALSAPCRHAFLLNRLDGMSQRKIAAHLGISEKTVERHVLRALIVCRNALDGR